MARNFMYLVLLELLVVVTFGYPGNRNPKRFENCGIQDYTLRINNGIVTDIAEFPWAALLLYKDGFQGCGGVLISSKFVLTAAHCLVGSGYDTFGPLEYVRLGEYNTLTDPDTMLIDGFKYTNDKKIDATPRFMKTHPDYFPNSVHQEHDIGLIEIDREMKFTSLFVWPICLPESDATKVLQDGTSLTVCGWGKTNFFDFEQSRSTIKLKASLPLVDRKKCEQAHLSENLSLGPGQFCAGGNNEKDSCSGDSGSPLVYHDLETNKWKLIGLVSRGPTRCGTAGRPGIYTNVMHYLPWIDNSTFNSFENHK